MTRPRIGSLFSGYGGLDMAVQAVYDAETAWHCQWEPPDPKTGRPDPQFAAAVLAHHWPGVPNLGDITQVNWRQVAADHGPIDILTGGFPCTDVSLAGRRAGLNDQTRSGLWTHMARAVAALRPKLVIIENVRGLLSSPATGNVELCTWCLGDGPDQPVLRALGAVLADLAQLGLDAEWVGLPAAAVGAPHERYRILIYAWPADTSGPRLEVRREGRPARAATADPDQLGAHRAGACGAGRHEPADGRQPAAAPASIGRREGGAEPARFGWGPDASLGGPPDWGVYEGAIRRWEQVLGRPAPGPVDHVGRLSPHLTEWMMGLPDGWLTAVPAPPGMTDSQVRNAQLKAAGNGVVPQQAEAALRILHHRAGGSA